MNVDYADDITLLSNTPAQAESWLHSLGAGNTRHCSLHEHKQNRVHVF